MKTYTQLKEEIEKGCGEIIEFKNDKFDNLWECKDGFLCPTCKAKLQILKESRMIFIQEELEFLKKVFSWSPNAEKRISQLQKELKQLEEKGE